MVLIGTKRERWWRWVDATHELTTADVRDDPDARGAFAVYLHQLVQQYFDRVMTYVDEEWDDVWRSAGTVGDWTELRLTPEELTSLNAELAAVIARHTPSADTVPGTPGRRAAPVLPPHGA